MPKTYKLCTFNCIYCHYGITNTCTDDASEHLSELPKPEDVRSELTSSLEKDKNIDYITFSGNAESTLHPEFEKIVDVVVDVRNKLVPHIKIALLSNSSLINKEYVKRSLKKIDLKIMKLDCGREETFNKINRPCSATNFDKLVENLKNTDDIIIQTILLNGKINNIDDEEINKWIKKIDYIKPKSVQIYTSDRPSSESEIEKVDKEILTNIAEKTTQKTGVVVEVF